MSTKSNTSSPEKVNVPTDPVQLAAAVKAQVEYYFSKDNLKNDSFLLSKMDAQNTVDVATILSFAKLKALTQDEAVVLNAVKDSSVVLVVNGRLKAAAKPGRTTIILREIPSNTPESEIREIFNYPGCKPISSIKSDIGDTWFVVMESEADAKDVVLDLKLKKRMFNGTAVKARLKSEAVANRSSFPTNVTSPMANNMYPVMYPFANTAGGQMDVPQQQFYNNNNNNQRGGSEGGSPKGRNEHRDGNNNNSNSGKGSRNDNRRGGKSGGNRDNNGRGDSNNRKNNNNNNNANNQKNSSRKESRANTNIDISSMNFPPLPPQGQGSDEVVQTTTTAPAIEDYSQIGYGDKPFHKYQIDDIINIVKNIKEAVLPDSIRTTEHPLAMEPSPNVDLLLRQRTFSIDETREQMQQGRPVQRDAVIAGEVDYNSVMYGDCQNQGSTSGTTSPTTKPQQSQQQKTNAGGSWAGVLKSSAGTAVPDNTTSPGNKMKPSSSTAGKTNSDKPNTGKVDSKKSDNKKDGKGGKSGDKKSRNGNRGGRHDNKDKDSGSSGPPLKWGDKPSFANVLKSNEEGSNSDKKPKDQNTQRKQRSRSGSESSAGGKGVKAQPSADDSTWSKQQLPPLKNEAP